MKIKSIIAAYLLASTAAFGSTLEVKELVVPDPKVPTDTQVKEAIRQTKIYLADTLKDPSSYKEGDWTIWMGTDQSGNVIVRCLHEYSATNGFGGRNSETILGSESHSVPLDKWDRPTGSQVKGWLFTNLRNYRVGNMDIGAMIYENMKKEMASIPEKNIIVIKAARILGKEIVN